MPLEWSSASKRRTNRVKLVSRMTVRSLSLHWAWLRARRRCECSRHSLTPRCSGHVNPWLSGCRPPSTTACGRYAKLFMTAITRRSQWTAFRLSGGVHVVLAAGAV